MARLDSKLHAESMAYKPVFVFINGEFWGVYNARERFDEKYFETVYGVPEEDLAVLECPYPIPYVKFEYLLQKEQVADSKNPYVIKHDTPKTAAITLIAILSVWLIALVAYVYSNWILEVNRWQLFIWAIPVSSIIWQFCNRLWGNKVLGRIITSITSWTIILGIYISLLPYNMWMVFIIGIPIQLIIILSSALKKTK